MGKVLLCMVWPLTFVQAITDCTLLLIDTDYSHLASLASTLAIIYNLLCIFFQLHSTIHTVFPQH